ncbi:MAG: 3-phosphoserine/phosphohydroxythreonine transaminase [Haliscomenobacteraceae bacterium CHB4]|nr:Phosphoserine aminotransferase [Saprospiraceae bacterium]MCE7924201.1 3-phosphoserine/phosphohydroxythreonine transaminase [Haliscomenobacteraceae bacterium CHB4]
MKKHNFSAGPAILPAPVLKEASKAALNYQGIGLSLLELSHRGPEFTAIIEEANALIKEIIGLPEGYHVLWLTGGASTQFFMIPMNLLNEDETAAYVNTGVWADKAIKEAKAFGHVNVIASSKEQNFTFIPKGYKIPKDAKYLHLTSNNTIYGTQLHRFPKSPVPLVCDMSSDFLSRPFDPNPFGLIYAGAQKNLGPAGTTVVIVREDMLGTVRRHLPSMLDYRTFVKENSLYNTPPVFPIYVSMLTLRWIRKNGGLKGMQRRNKAKAAILYNEIDRNPLFKGTVAREDRSLMNICFVMEDKYAALEKEFLKETEANGMVGLKGHRSVGGFRASTYNALPKASVQALADLMQDFARRKG